MSIKVTILTLVAFTAVNLVRCQVIGWRNCGNPLLATVHGLTVIQAGGSDSDNCVTMPCRFIRGNSYIIQVDATKYIGSNTLRFEIIGHVLGLNITLSTGDACDNMIIGSCPSVPGSRFAFEYQQAVQSNLPPVPAVVTSNVMDDDGTNSICIQIDTIIV